MLKKIFLFISVFLVFLIPVNAETSSIPTRDLDEYISKMDIPVTPDKSKFDISGMYHAEVPMSEMKYRIVTTEELSNWSDGTIRFSFLIYWSSKPFVWNSSTNQFDIDSTCSMYTFGDYYIKVGYKFSEYYEGYYRFEVGGSSNYNNFTYTSLSYSSHKILDTNGNVVFRPAPQAVVSKETAQGLVETILANRNLILGSTLCLVAFLLLLKVLYKGLLTFSQTP